MKTKKIIGLTMASAMVFGLVACDFADGIGHDFGLKATDTLAEIDDDTMEMELSDVDDVANFDLLTVEADTKREVAFVKSFEAMLKLQDKVVAGDREALKEYLKARKSAMKSLGITNYSDNGYHTIPDFAFTEED